MFTTDQTVWKDHVGFFSKKPFARRIPRTSSLATLYDPATIFNLSIVEDPDGDDIEDGLAGHEDVDEEDDDQDKENGGQDGAGISNGPAGTSGAPETEDTRENFPVNLTGWDQPLPEKVIDAIANCDKLNYCLESSSTLTGNTVSPPSFPARTAYEGRIWPSYEVSPD